MKGAPFSEHKIYSYLLILYTLVNTSTWPCVWTMLYSKMFLDSRYSTESTEGTASLFTSAVPICFIRSSAFSLLRV